MNYKTQAQWIKRAEDVVLSMIHLTDQAAEFPKDDYKAKALRRGAIAIQLVIATRLCWVRRCLDNENMEQSYCERIKDKRRYCVATNLCVVVAGDWSHQ